MAEPLKNLYTPELVTSVAQQIHGVWPNFDSDSFIKAVFDEDWQQRELKQRMAHITECLYQFLPLPYPEATSVLVAAASHFEGFEYMFFPGFVEKYGLQDYDTSVDALGRLTAYASSEFAVRPFIKQYPRSMMEQMLQWALSDNEHQRRLASEGCRPRLPWAMALPDFQKDPGPVLPILETLKHDSSEYVRRSVANNLNDIAKDHPQLVLDIARRWQGISEDTDRLVRHACRSLLKQGYAEVMELFGYSPPDQINLRDFRVDKTVAAGGTVNFSFVLDSSTGVLGQVRVDYAIGFLRQNGSLSDKVFKLSESNTEASSRLYEKSFSFKPITTRRYYPGKHELAIMVNGVEQARAEFELLE